MSTPFTLDELVRELKQAIPDISDTTARRVPEQILSKYDIEPGPGPWRCQRARVAGSGQEVYDLTRGEYTGGFWSSTKESEIERVAEVLNNLESRKAH